MGLRPAVGRVRLLRTWGGIMDMSMDGSPIIDRTHVEGLFLDAGWNYGGFKAVPASGWCMAHLMATGDAHPVARRFRPDRFLTGHPLAEEGTGTPHNPHCEQGPGRLPRATADALLEARLFSVLLPPAIGGHGGGHADVCDVIEELSRADAAAGWCVSIGTTNNTGMAEGLPPALAALEVAGGPSYSPFSTKFDPMRILRIEVQHDALKRAVDNLKKNPDLRYISDGDPAVVSVPASTSEKLGNLADKLGRPVITY